MENNFIMLFRCECNLFVSKILLIFMFFFLFLQGRFTKSNIKKKKKVSKKKFNRR